MERPPRKHLIAIGSLLLFQTVGAIGLRIPEVQTFFQDQLILSLLLIAVVTFLFHKDWTPPFFATMSGVFLAGFLLEVAGVKTGVIFGEYRYGDVLGWKIAEVPLLIGLNWVVLVYSSAMLVRRIESIWLKSILGAVLMVVIDLLLEPVAIRFGYWEWSESIIPLRNYLAWGLAAFGFHLLLNKYSPPSSNPTAAAAFIIQLLFFTSFFLFP